jgi:hypothetical protein
MEPDVRNGRLNMPKLASHKKTGQKARKNVAATPAMAIHAKMPDGEHLIGIGNLRVAIESDGKCWTAQGLEIDYIAQGCTLDEAKKQFEDGLACTIHQHLRIYGDIEKLLTPAPREVWREVLNPKAIRARYSHISTHDVIKQAFGFDKVDYLVLAASAA